NLHAHDRQGPKGPEQVNFSVATEKFLQLE
ncbi:hypothetical protein CFOL_v3_34068, partial [Cephalotus follicularis]